MYKTATIDIQRWRPSASRDRASNVKLRSFQGCVFIDISMSMTPIGHYGSNLAYLTIENKDQDMCL